MIKEIKASFGDFQLGATYHGDEEYVLKAGNRNRTSLKVNNRCTKNFEVFQVWTKNPVNSQRDVLRMFQKLVLNALSGGLPPGQFSQTMGLVHDSLATEIRYNFYHAYYEKMRNVLSNIVLPEEHSDKLMMALVQDMFKSGIDCGLNLTKGAKA